MKTRTTLIAVFAAIVPMGVAIAGDKDKSKAPSSQTPKHHGSSSKKKPARP